MDRDAPTPVFGAFDRPPTARRLWASWRYWLTLAAFSLLMLAALGGVYWQQRAEESVRLLAVSRLQATQIGQWLADNRRKADFASSSQLYADLFQAWQTRGDTASRDRLLARLSELRRAHGHQRVLLVDAQGQVLLTDDAADGVWGQGVPEVLHSLVHRALAEGGVLESDLFSPDAQQPTRRALAVLAPLKRLTSPHQAVVVFVHDPETYLFPLLRAWPGQSESGESILLSQGAQGLQGPYGRQAPVPLAQTEVLAAKVLRGEWPTDTVLWGQDIKGRQVLGVVRPVADSRWHLVSKVDHTEVLMHSLAQAYWVYATLLAGWLVITLVFLFMQERRRADSVQEAQAQQQARLHALSLLQAVADSSTDAIFAKDRQGRYLLYSKAACQSLGLTPEAVLGQTDLALFPPAQALKLMANDAQVIDQGQVTTYEEEVNTPRGTQLFQSLKGPLRDAQGQVIGLFGIARDVTESRRVARALEDSLLTIQAVEDSVLDHMAVLNREGVIVTVNEAWRQFGACTSKGGARFSWIGAGVGVNYFELCTQAEETLRATGVEPGSDGELSCASLTEGLRHVLSGALETYETEYACHSAGVPRWFHMSITPLRTSAGGAVVVHSDISARVRAEQALRESAALYRSMVQSLSEGVIIFGPDGQAKACNASAERILDLSEQDMPRTRARLSAWRPVHTDGSPYPLDELPLNRTLATGQACHGVVLGDLRADGQVRWLWVNAEPVTVMGEHRSGDVVVSLTDITARFQAEQTLQKLSLAVEQSPNSIFITNNQGVIEYANQACEAMTGHPVQDLLGQTPRLLSSGQTPEARFTQMWATLATGQTWKGEFVNRRRDGEVRDVYSLIAPIRQANGQVTHYVCVQEDITERKRIGQELDRHRHHLEELVTERTRDLEQAIAERTASENFTRLVAENIHGMVAYWDRDQRCRFANQAYARLFGRTPQAVIGMRLDELLGVVRYPQVLPYVLGVLQGQVQHYERTLPAQGASGPIYTWAHFVPDSRDGQVLGFFVLVTDITDIKQAELALQRLNAELVVARDRAEQANRAKSSFLANMSHEIRTPMNAIMGLTHLLRRDGRDPQTLERVQRLQDASQHLLRLINDILDLARIESGKLRMEHIVFALPKVLQTSRELVTPQALAKGLNLQFNATPDLPTNLVGDPTRLTQVLVNLLGNAVKFTAQGQVVLSIVLVHRHTDGFVTLRLSVQDTGMGMDPAQIERLFEAFEQADLSTTRKYGGSGLGLAIARHLVHMMGGQLGVESEPGRGSTFWFTVRLALPDGQTSTALSDSDWAGLADQQTVDVELPLQPSEQPGLPAPVNDVPDSEWQALVQDVRQGLATSDFRVHALLRQHEALLRLHLGPGVNQVRERVQAHHYEDALVVWQALLRQTAQDEA